MTIDDYSAVTALWEATEGVAYHPEDADSPGSIARYLERNPGLSQVATDDGRLVGAVLSGHDGRRGSLHHLAVACSHRGRRVGRTLVERALAGLEAEGISRCNILVFSENTGGLAFWERLGWERYRGKLEFLMKWTGERSIR
jgi:ribosomal protein S18 acetylase RimI-like enzyme